MTNEQINKTIAEACGWTMRNETCTHPYGYAKGMEFERTYWTNKDGKAASIPKYSGCLNAMHEAEKQMKLSDITSYREMLFDWLKLDCVCASASTKAEAFLRTIGKWEDEA